MWGGRKPCLQMECCTRDFCNPISIPEYTGVDWTTHGKFEPTFNKYFQAFSGPSFSSTSSAYSYSSVNSTWDAYRHNTKFPSIPTGRVQSQLHPRVARPKGGDWKTSGDFELLPSNAQRRTTHHSRTLQSMRDSPRLRRGRRLGGDGQGLSARRGLQWRGRPTSTTLRLSPRRSQDLLRLPRQPDRRHGLLLDAQLQLPHLDASQRRDLPARQRSLAATTPHTTPHTPTQSLPHRPPRIEPGVTPQSPFPSLCSPLWLPVFALPFFLALFWRDEQLRTKMGAASRFNHFCVPTFFSRTLDPSPSPSRSRSGLGIMT